MKNKKNCFQRNCNSKYSKFCDAFETIRGTNEKKEKRDARLIKLNADYEQSRCIRRQKNIYEDENGECSIKLE